MTGASPKMNRTPFSIPIQVSTASSNPDGSSYNNLQEQFIGDYIDIVLLTSIPAGGSLLPRPVVRPGSARRYPRLAASASARARS